MSEFNLEKHLALSAVHFAFMNVETINSLKDGEFLRMINKLEVCDGDLALNNKYEIHRWNGQQFDFFYALDKNYFNGMD